MFICPSKSTEMSAPQVLSFHSTCIEDIQWVLSRWRQNHTFWNRQSYNGKAR